MFSSSSPRVGSPWFGYDGLAELNKNPVTIRKSIEDLGKSAYIAVSTGFWYEWSLAIAPAFGFDFAKKSVTFFDEGETKISISTWPQVYLS